MRLLIVLSVLFIFNLKSQEKSNSFEIVKQSQKHVARSYYKDDRMVHIFLEEIKGVSIENNVLFNALDLNQRTVSPVSARFSYNDFIKLTGALSILQKLKDSDFKYEQNIKALISPSNDFSVSLTFEDERKVYTLILGNDKIFNAEMNEESFKNFVGSCLKVKNIIEKGK